MVHIKTLLVGCLLILGSCSPIPAEKTSLHNNNYDQVKEIAWKFLQENEWQGTNGDWKSAKVNITVADNTYELLDEEYKDQQVLSISFIDEDNVSVSAPIVLVDANKKVVVGFMLGE